MSVLYPLMATPPSLKRSHGDTELNEAVKQDAFDNISQHQCPPYQSDGDSYNAPRFSGADIDELIAKTKNSALPTHIPNLPLSHGPAISPGPSSSGLSTLNSSPIKFPGSSAHSASPSKRPKLDLPEKVTPKLDKETRQRINEEKRAERAETARQREIEKAKREEIRQAKLLEKEEKRKAREEEHKAREEEKRLKEEEKAKKSRSQLKLNAFFVQPSISKEQSEETPNQGTRSPSGSRRNSISSVHDAGTFSRQRSTSATPQKHRNEHERLFPPFFLQSYTTLGLWNNFTRDEDSLQHARSGLDRIFNLGNTTTAETQNQPEPSSLTDLLHVSPLTRYRRRPQKTAKDLVAEIHGTAQNPVGLTSSKATQTPLDHLKALPIKYLKFWEDVRPPYIGTRTQLPAGLTLRQLGRRSCKRANASLDYDYDSEAEWEPLGEGEDLNSEGEDDLEEEDDGDDMTDFVVDEGILEAKKQPFIVAKEQTSTGVCWEDSSGKSRTAVGDGFPSTDMQQYKLEMIADHPTLPIDPHSTVYWASTTKAKQSAPTSSVGMNPPRVPLNAINRTNLNLPNTLPLKDTKGPPQGVSIPPVKASKPVTVKRFIAPELLEDFKKAVAGVDANKNLMVEMLKKQFPTQSKATIQDTLGAVAERVGAKEADKRWAIRPEHVLCKEQGCMGMGAAACEHLAAVT